jgi:hypothetical protein
MAGLPPGTMLVTSGRDGAANIAMDLAINEVRLATVGYPGLEATEDRNQLMLDKHQPHLVIAFHENLMRSRLTRDMVLRAKKADIPVDLVTGKENI